MHKRRTVILTDLRAFDSLSKSITEELSQYYFEKAEFMGNVSGFHPVRLWRFKRILFNSAVILFPYIEAKQHPGEFASEIKMGLGKKIGYYRLKFFLDPLSLHIVMFTHNIMVPQKEIEQYIDKSMTKKVILKSLHIVDGEKIRSASARSMTCCSSGKHENAIEKAISLFLEKEKRR